MNPFLIGLPGFLVCVLTGYVMRACSYRHLDTVQAGTVSLGVRPIRIRFVIVSSVILVVFLVLRFSMPQHEITWFLAMLALSAAATVYCQVTTRASMKQTGLPAVFLQTYWISQVFDTLGILMLVGAMATTPFMDMAGK